MLLLLAGNSLINLNSMLVCCGNNKLNYYTTAIQTKFDQIYSFSKKDLPGFIFIYFQLLTHKRFFCVEKIKTVGQTYMCASGLTSRTNFSDLSHVTALADYTFALQNQMQYINENSFNNFVMRIGLCSFMNLFSLNF